MNVNSLNVFLGGMMLFWTVLLVQQDKQNPFDFDTLLATISAQPTQTTPTQELTFPPDWTFFPYSLHCSENPGGIGPRWRDQVTIGRTMIKELVSLYKGNLEIHDDTYILNGEGWSIWFCADEENVITALRVGSDFAYFRDYVAIYGIPDAVTYDPFGNARDLFWFEEGIAIDVYINTNAPDYYGLVNYMAYFPYQSNENYEDTYPYSRTRGPEQVVPVRDANISDEQNPFDFDAILATITAGPMHTPVVTPTQEPTATP